jgi:hypothetical protein
MLTNFNSAASGTGIVANESIVLYTPYINLSNLPLNNGIYNDDPENYIPGTNLNILEILSGTNAGEFVVSGVIQPHFIRIDQGSPDTIPESPTVPHLDETVFSFRLSNVVYTNAINNIAVDKINLFSDENTSFVELNVKSQWDVDHDPNYSGGPWQINVTSPFIGLYDIENVMPDGNLIISGNIAADTTNIEYELRNDLGSVIATSSTGEVVLNDRAIVTVTDAGETDLRDRISIGQYVAFGGNQYKIISFLDGETHKFYIDYSGSNTTTSIYVYDRLAEDIGYIGYTGMKLIAAGNYETSLGIINGANASGYPWPNGGFLEEGSGTDDDHMKENFLISIGTDYYVIDDINGNNPSGFTTFNMNGPMQSWTLAGTSSTAFAVYRGTKAGFMVPERIYPAQPEFDFTAPIGGGPPTTGIDRRGKDLVEIQIDTITPTPMAARASILNSAKKNQMLDNITQTESVSYEIEWREEKNE